MKRQHLQSGFTLLELIMVLLLVGIFGAVAVTATGSSIGNQSADETLLEMIAIRNALVGNADLSERGSRSSFGYHGDVGALPSAIIDLTTKPALVSNTSTNQVDRVALGWSGPYIDAAQLSGDYERDQWGNLYQYSPLAATPTLTSYGQDGVAGGGGLDQDIIMELPLSGRTATVHGFLVSGGEGSPSSVIASINLHYPDGLGGQTTATTTTAVADNGYFSFSNVPFGVRSATITVGATVTGPIIFTVDRSEYTIPVSLTEIGGAACAGRTISFQTASSSGSESTTSVNLVVAVSAACAYDMTVNYALANGTATSPSDYIAASGTLTIAAGSTSITLPITIVNDASAEIDETLTATLSAPSSGATLGATPTHTYTILNDDVVPCVSGVIKYTSNTTFTVPANCTSLVIKAWGAGGGAGGTGIFKSGAGGGGGYAYTNSIAVTPGETFTVTVGIGGNAGRGTCTGGGGGAYQGGPKGVMTAGGAGGGPTAGGSGGAAGSYAGGAGRYGGGGAGSGNAIGESGGQGGGATSVVRDSTSLEIVIAGGGGGGGGSDGGVSGAAAGAGGVGCGDDGRNGGTATRGGGGGGGACFGPNSASGAGRNPSNSAQAGTNGVGGAVAASCATDNGTDGAVRFEYN